MTTITAAMAAAAQAMRARSRSPHGLPAHATAAGATLKAGSGLPLADLLYQVNVLDENAVAFLKQAPLGMAQKSLLLLGPEVEDASVFVIEKVKELQGVKPPVEPGSVLTFYHNGNPETLEWLDQEQAVRQLESWGVLDTGSADFLLKASEVQVKDIITALGPETRNPSAIVTRKLKELQRRGELGSTDPTAPIERISFFHNGVPAELEWVSQQQAVGELVTSGILDQRSGDFLLMAPEKQAKGIIQSLGPEVRNASAVVTRLFSKELKTGGAQLRQSPNMPAETFTVHNQGVAFPLQWSSQEQAIMQLLGMGVLDDKSADYLMKASETQAKAIVKALGPDVRNASAVVTKLFNQGLQAFPGGNPMAQPMAQNMPMPGSMAPRMHQAPGGFNVAPPEWLTVHCNGTPYNLCWSSQEQAVTQLLEWGILDTRSAEYLMQGTAQQAKEILSSLGPEVRNPSAVVTRLFNNNKGMQLGQSFQQKQGATPPMAWTPGQSMHIHVNGVPYELSWLSQELAVAELLHLGVLDPTSADFLSKAPEDVARSVVAQIGPDVRNASAFVTKKLKGLVR